MLVVWLRPKSGIIAA